MTKKKIVFLYVLNMQYSKFSACPLTLCYFQNIFKDDIRHLFF